jgi:hypothetical protein
MLSGGRGRGSEGEVAAASSWAVNVATMISESTRDNIVGSKPIFLVDSSLSTRQYPEPLRGYWQFMFSHAESMSTRNSPQITSCRSRQGRT